MIVYPGINAMVEALVLVSLAGPCIEAQSSASSPQKYFDDGERALAAHHYGEAEKAYEKLAQLDPGSAEVHAKLGMIYFQERKFEKAATALREALRLRTTNSALRLSASSQALGSPAASTRWA